MTTGPDEIRARIEALLAALPDIGESGEGDAEFAGSDLDEIAQRLSEAHDVLVRALESAEKEKE